MQWFLRLKSWKLLLFTVGVVVSVFTYTKDTLVLIIHPEASALTSDASCSESQTEEEVYFTSCGGFF